MKKVKVPFGSWYLDGDFTFTFPHEWNVVEAWPKGAWADRLEDSEIKKRFDSPTGTQTIAELARRKQNAILLIDDLTRPTPTYRVIPFILDELKRGGIEDDKVDILVSMGTHRNLNRLDLERKLGKNVVDRLRIFSHNPYENCRYIGVTSRGTPIYINEKVLDADLRIGIGGVYPHSDAGWSGGGKIVCPGASGIETIDVNHQIKGSGRCVIEGNENRADLEEVALKAGLDIIVNMVMNCKRQVTGLFVGDVIKAHREAVKVAETAYATEVPRDVDIAVTNAYPADTEFLQSLKALWAAEWAKEDGTIVVSTYSPEGFGWHELYHRRIRDFTPPEKSVIGRRIGERKVIVVSPNLNLRDVHRYYPRRTLLFRSWEGALGKLEEIHGGEAGVSVFPCALLQYGLKKH